MIFVPLRTVNVLGDVVSPHGNTYFLTLLSWWSSGSILSGFTLQR